MNTKKFKIFAALLGLILAFAACQPDEFSLGKMLSKEDLSYSITQNPDDPNMIYLESLTPGVTPMWVTPVGRSTNIKDTVKIAFAGDYKFVYGVESVGGFVQADTFNLSITTNNYNYVNDPLWALISGGKGNSKTWYLDLDADGTSRFFLGPMYFFRSWYTWDGLHTASGGNYIDSKPWDWTAAVLPTLEREGDPDPLRSGAPMPDVQAWYWPADWPGNQWMTPAADFGTMTFNLIDGANVIVDQDAYGLGLNEGSYIIDAKNHTLKFSDVRPLHDKNHDADAVNWYNVQILYLTKDAMQLGIVPDGDAASMTVYNYISRDYLDSYVPADQPDPEPELPDGWQDDISQTVSTTIVWKLSESNPLDWANLDGSMMNGWQTPEDYPDWLGTPDPSAYGSFSMTMNSADQSVVFVTPDETTTEGTYSVDEKGIYSFDIDVPTFTVVGWAGFAADANNQLRILQIEKDASGAVTGMWLGARSSEEDEYMAYHLVPQAGGGGGNSEPQGTEIAFDNSKLAIGDLEDKGNLRLELYNEYGSTKADPGINISELVFSNRIDVTFTISGISLKDGAAGSYDASMYYADADWSPNGNGDVITVNGDGRYTVSYAPPSDVDGAVVFVIDIVSMGTDISDLSAVTATIDNVVLY